MTITPDTSNAHRHDGTYVRAFAVPTASTGTRERHHMVGRPPVVAVADGRARLLVRRESAEDLRDRDAGL
ncbi:hypothetical protein [Streptomyces sp. NPDC058695]|uniref:hypothetical protein n=1 Tax=Streptomyces sp. NPDC058695 TaxID=3346604 RepID=UPI00366079D5